MRLPPTAPVVALDIDGSLADYYDHFTWFAGLYLQRELSATWNREFRGEFSEALGLEKHLYRQIKLAYRQGGMKRSIKPFYGAGDLVRNLRAQGIQVWICTTRPWNRLDNIDPDTNFWLDHNLGRVDGVIYGEDKYADLIDIVGKDRILGIMDDLPENIQKAQSLDLKTVLMKGDHNEWWTESHQNIGVNYENGANNIGEFRKITKEWIREYRRDNKDGQA